MAPSAIQSSVNILPGVQGAAGKAISQTNRDIVANRKALRMGANPISTAMIENKSAAEALKAEMGFSMAPPEISGTPISAKAALKRKAVVLEENSDTDYSAPATPIPMPKISAVVEDVKDTVRYFVPLTLVNVDYGNQGIENDTMNRNSTLITIKTSRSDKVW
jgi:hypothetical protein